MPELNERLKNIRLELALLVNSLDRTDPAFKKLIISLEQFGNIPRFASIKEDILLIDKLTQGLHKAGVETEGIHQLSTRLRELVGALRLLGGQKPQAIFGELKAKGISQFQRADIVAGVRQGQGAQLEEKVNANLKLQIAKEQQLFAFRIAADNKRGIAMNQLFDMLKRELAVNERLAGVDARRNQLFTERRQLLSDLRGGEEDDRGLPLPLVKGQGRNIGARIASGEDIGIPGGDRGLANFNQQLKELELTNAKLTGQFDDVATGVRRFTFEQKLSNGVVRTGEIAVDRLGNVLTRTSGSFRGFTDSLIRNIGKFTQWSLAIGLVFLPLRALQGLMEKSKATQEALAKAAVSVGSATANLNDILQASATIAQQTGSSLQGVIEGYGQAYAATGGLGSQAARAAVAQNLLLESMVLSKLAGIEQGQALDTLVGILRQTGKELTDGRSVIDSFVAVSRQANVSINSLASAFAIVGTAAEDAGIDFDHLNGLAAALAESTKLSADETGNAIRGFISGFQSAKAEDVLAKYGIAVRTANGEVRDFIDVFRELARLKQGGANGEELLNPDAIREITNAVGGGFRRGAQFATLLENFSRYDQLAAVSENATGEAAAALETRLDTLETATTRLGNSLTNLAASMGQEGGILGTFTGLANLFSKIIDLLAGITRTAGPALTALLAFQAVSLISSRTDIGQKIAGLTVSSKLGGLLGGAGRLQQVRAVGGIGGQLNFAQFLAAANQGGGAQLGRIPGLERLTRGLGRAGLLGLGTTAITAGSALARGKPDEAAGALVGALIGGLIGSATIIGTPIGAAIGSIAGQQFIATVGGPAGTGLQAYFADLGRERADTKKPPEDETATERAERIAKAFDDAATFADKFDATVQAALGLLDKDVAELPFKQRRDIALVGQLTGPDATEEAKKAAELFLELLIEGQIAAGEPIAATYSEAFADNMVGEVRPIGEAIAKAFVDEMLVRLGRGTATVAEFETAKEQAPGFDEKLRTVAAALRLAGDQRDIATFGKAFIEFDKASSEFLLKLANEANQLTDAARSDPSQLDERNEKYRELIDAASAIQLSQQASDVDLLGILNLGEVSASEADKILKRGQELYEEYLNEFVQDPAVIAEIQARLAEQLVAVVSGGEAKYIGRTRTPSQFINQAAAESGFGQPVSRKLLDERGKLSLADMPALLGRMEAIRKSLELQFPLYYATLDQNEENNLILSDGFTQIIGNGDILNLAMEDLIEVNEKQLEGIINIPDGVTAAIPFTGALTFGGRGGGTTGVGDNAPFGPSEPMQSGLPVPGGGVTFGGAPPSMVEDMRNFLAKGFAIEETGELIAAMNRLTGAIQGDIDEARGVRRTGEYPRGEPIRRAIGAGADTGGRGDIAYESYGEQRLRAERDRLLQLQSQLTPPASDDLGSRIEKALSPEAWGDWFSRIGSAIGSFDPQSLLQTLGSIFPESIPVSVKFNLTTQNLVTLDGRAISQALQSREYSEFANATRRSGAVGYEVA